MTPTDDDLDRAMAEARGWYEDERYDEESHWFIWFSADHVPQGGLPAFCTDRRLLPDVLALVERLNVEFEFTKFLRGQCQPHVPETELIWQVLDLPMRTIVEAALRATGHWREEWK